MTERKRKAAPSRGWELDAEDRACGRRLPIILLDIDCNRKRILEVIHADRDRCLRSVEILADALVIDNAVHHRLKDVILGDAAEREAEEVDDA